MMTNEMTDRKREKEKVRKNEETKAFNEKVFPSMISHDS